MKTHQNKSVRALSLRIIIAKLMKGGMRIAKSNCAFATKPIRLSIVAFFFLLAGLAGLTGVFTGKAQVPPRTPRLSPRADVLARQARVSGSQAPIPPPTCPGPECQKKITIWNNTDTAIYAAIQAGAQNPDPWLQALFGNNQQSYAETHLSRVYINLTTGGIPAHGYVRVTVPWFSHLQNDTDQYADWFNGGRVIIFDMQAAAERAHMQDIDHPLTLAGDSPQFSCDNCNPADPLTLYSDTVEFVPATTPFQLIEYTFFNVETPSGQPPYIGGTRVNYNTSYVDQLYLPTALAPCEREPVNTPCQADPSAVGYLGTIEDLGTFRRNVKKWFDKVGWVRYNSDLDDSSRPRIPSPYNVITDRVNVSHGQPSVFTDLPNDSWIWDMINLWNTCTVDHPNSNDCPQAQLYKELNDFFIANYNTYYNNGMQPPGCNLGGWPRPTPSPSPCGSPPCAPVPLETMQYAYGWAAFNAGCPASFNALGSTPSYTQVQFDYVHYLQYNFNKAIRVKPFNPYVQLVHDDAYADANSYAFSIDDAAGFQSKDGEGLIIAVGGSNGLPNPNRIPLDPDFTKDFEMILGDSIGAHAAPWAKYGVCKDTADQDFPPLPPNARVDTPHLVVDTEKNHIDRIPCTITVQDADNNIYQFTVKKPVHPPDSWPAFQAMGRNHHDPNILTCNPGNTWCNNINETAVPTGNVMFFLNPPAPKRKQP
jgi:hypothetical protein